MESKTCYSSKQILIFEGVLQLLQEGVPIHDLKVAQIAESAGMGKSTAYEYFTSKEEIIREALAYHLEENFKSMVQEVFASENFQGILERGLDFLERSLEKQLTWIFFLMVTEPHHRTDKGSYLDPLRMSAFESMTEKEVLRMMELGKREGAVGSEVTLSEVKMLILGLFSAFVHELLSMKGVFCGRPGTSLMENEAQELQVEALKKRTIRLMMKALA